IESAGLLCSEAELELGDDAGQVLLLPHDATPGAPLVELAGVADTVLELEVTANRGDCLSILGVAREVAATSGVRLRRPRPRPREGGAPAARDVGVRVESADCPRYCARLVRAVAVQPSPLWLRLRLRRAGMRPVNVDVDATNHVMLERGQPLHAFDWEQLAEHRIVVRGAAARERLLTLDGIERVLDPADLVIADARGPVALAGVMGGQVSEVTAGTRVLLLVAVPRAQIGRRLSALGATCRAAGDALTVTPPSHRGDLQREEDLVEEVARLGGYDAIPASLPEVPLTSGEDSRARVAARRL